VTDGKDVLRRDHIQDVEDRPVLLEDAKIDVFPSHHRHGPLQGAVGQDRGPLLDELEKQDLPDGWRCGAISLPQRIPNTPHPGKEEAGQASHPDVDHSNRFRIQ